MPTKLSGNLVAVDATKYQLLRAASKDSMEHWYQSQEYKRQLLASRRENRVLWAVVMWSLSASAGAAAMILEVCR